MCFFGWISVSNSLTCSYYLRELLMYELCMRSYLSTIGNWKYIAHIYGDLSANLHVDRFHRVTLSSECRPGGSHCCVTFGCRPIFEVQTIEVAVLTVCVPPRSCKYRKHHQIEVVVTSWLFTNTKTCDLPFLVNAVMVLKVESLPGSIALQNWIVLYMA